MTTTTLPTITHRITYDATTRDYACYVQISGDPEQYIGSADSYHEGELKCLDYKRDLIDLDSRPIPRCDDCKSPLGDLGFCEECADRTEEPEPTLEQWAELDADMDEWLRGSDPGQALDSLGLCGCRAGEPEQLKDLPAYAETSPQPNDTLLDAAWRAYKATRDRDDADRVTWADVVAIQRQFMPRCAAHGVHTAIKHDGNPICAQCIEERGFNPPAMRVAA